MRGDFLHNYRVWEGPRYATYLVHFSRYVLQDLNRTRGRRYIYTGEEGGAKGSRPTMSELAKGCEHFLEFRQTHGLQSFKIIYKYLVKPGQEARKLKVTCSLLCVAFTIIWGRHAPTSYLRNSSDNYVYIYYNVCMECCCTEILSGRDKNT